MELSDTDQTVNVMVKEMGGICGNEVGWKNSVKVGKVSMSRKRKLLTLATLFDRVAVLAHPSHS